MKNIHVLPTDKPSRLHLYTDENGTRPALCELEYSHTRNTQNIYITSDEEIKEGEYQLYNPLGNFDNAKVSKAERLLQNDGRRKKIILTTDQDLIKDGVQAIDDEFLEWFVKNPSCEWVDVWLMNKGYNKQEDYPYQEHYLIIIPKEEAKQIGQITEKGIIDTIGNCANCGVEFHIHKDVTEYKQETLEKAAERIANNFEEPNFKAGVVYGVIEGAKWQQEQILDFLYSEITERRDYSASKMCYKVIEFIEQFKKQS